MEIRAADLAFTVPETAELLAAHGLTLSDEQVAALHARTEGWGAGLRLAALSLQDHEDPERFLAEFAGDDRVVGDYLLAEVLLSPAPEAAQLPAADVARRPRLRQPRRRPDRRESRRGHARRRSNGPTDL